jgi:serine phosphatase RsbU (regulator of sigma subunit)
VTDVRTDLRGLLDAVEAAAPVDAVEVLACSLADMVGATDVTFLIADFSGDALIRFLSPQRGSIAPDADAVTTVPLPGSPHERALRSQEVQVVEDPDGARVYAPVTDRGDALGVLEPATSCPPTADEVAFIASAAHALAYVVIANRRHTDLFERGQRNRAFSLAGEIQRRLLPAAFTCEGAGFTLAGWLEPAHKVGGDTFDYSLERDALHLSITDAMGHLVRAALLATVAVGSLRNTRRTGADILRQAADANDAVLDHADGEEYVSGLLLRVELGTGVTQVVNAGHAQPYLVRDGVARTLALHADLPFGMFRAVPYRAQALQLRPGDRLVLVTDGMLERNAVALDVIEALHEMEGLHPREVVHAFARAVLGATGGDLLDDATVLCVDWYGQTERTPSRVASAGATQSIASAPGPEG